MLIDQHQSLFVLERDVRAPQLKEVRDGLSRSRDLSAQCLDRVLGPVCIRRCRALEQWRVLIDRWSKDLGIGIRRQNNGVEAEARAAKAKRCCGVHCSK